jgi:DNA-binding CsgD family transcriptional regulator
MNLYELAEPVVPFPAERDPCAPRHGGNPNSQAAHHSVAKHAESDRQRILAMIVAAGENGLTCDEACVILECDQNQISGRFSELYRRGQIEAVGKRPTRRGNNASVYRKAMT